MSEGGQQFFALLYTLDFVMMTGKFFFHLYSLFFFFFPLFFLFLSSIIRYARTEVKENICFCTLQPAARSSQVSLPQVVARRSSTVMVGGICGQY